MNMEFLILTLACLFILLWLYSLINSLHQKNDEIRSNIKQQNSKYETHLKNIDQNIQKLNDAYYTLDNALYELRKQTNNILDDNNNLLGKLRLFASDLNNRIRLINEKIDSGSINQPQEEQHPNVTPPESSITLGKEQREVLDFILHDNDNILISGAAGTGKSTLAKKIKESIRNICVVSPTGIAALNIQGSTIHSLFQLPPKDFLDKKHFSKINIVENIGTLLIDEISMVRPDILDVIDTICKKSKKNKEPFGGIRVIAIGDLCQLPPIIKNNVAHIFKKKYKHEQSYFFDAPAFKKGNFKKFNLTQVYRQSDSDMLFHLNNIRMQVSSNSAIDYFNNFLTESVNDFPNATIISPYKKIVETYNAEKLNALKTKEITYYAKTLGCYVKTSGSTEEDPAPRTLRLKEQALVMFTCNNYPLWVNGTTGIIKELQDDAIIVNLFDGRELTLQRFVWKSYEYIKNNKTIIQKEIGSFEQFPLQLGYAITVHKSQGKTLDCIVLDKGKSMFAPGQLYTALSRVRKPQDLHILRPIKEKDIIIDKRVISFMKKL